MGRLKILELQNRMEKVVAIPGVSEERPSVEERQRKEHYLVMVEILGVARLKVT